MTRAVCPGSFDPVTRGHLDVIGRAAALVEEVVVAVGANGSKRAWFTAPERVAMLEEACAGWPNVRVALFDGLLVDFCTAEGIGAVVKGLRSAADFAYELPMAQMNAHLSGVDTVFVAAAPAWSYLSSSLVREVAGLGGDVAEFLTPAVAERVRRRAGERGR
ncbi:Phosphopantetheine adenylyltransferase [Friedmanniella luteola]|uniref:Phosphopantetheine adenylyltransferase n=1 Tax=Friedmanniella luteola TaxID=546871 RepID=A0A1H1Q9K8_9ACTN|nr:pantetheine-phosphate adenylyltransferase [Friedmanniella luteola]SDS19579.1 Phosphopantetheine adenylyltransferase [Friedmanniella luteola]